MEWEEWEEATAWAVECTEAAWVEACTAVMDNNKKNRRHNSTRMAIINLTSGETCKQLLVSDKTSANCS